MACLTRALLWNTIQKCSNMWMKTCWRNAHLDVALYKIRNGFASPAVSSSSPTKCHLNHGQTVFFYLTFQKSWIVPSRALSKDCAWLLGKSRQKITVLNKHIAQFRKQQAIQQQRKVLAVSRTRNLDLYISDMSNKKLRLVTVWPKKWTDYVRKLYHPHTLSLTMSTEFNDSITEREILRQASHGYSVRSNIWSCCCCCHHRISVIIWPIISKFHKMILDIDPHRVRSCDA